MSMCLREMRLAFLKIFAILLVVGAVLSAEEASFCVRVTVEFLSLRLLDLGGEEYISFYTALLEPGDTATTDSAAGVWLKNESNVPTGLVAWACDDTFFVYPESVWAVCALPGRDTCAIGLALYETSCQPNISDAHWLSETPVPVASGLAPGESRFGYIFFVAPTDSAEYGEPQHRVRLTVAVFPE